MPNEVEIIVKGQDQSGPAFNAAEQRVSKLKSVTKVAGATLAAGGAAAGALFAKGVSDNMNIEQANDKLAAQMGLTADEAKKAGDVSGKVYGDNFGESIEDVNDAIKAVGLNIKDVGSSTKEEMEASTKAALTLSKTFDVDVNESTRAAGVMIKNGLAKNSKEAFDIMAAGFTSGADKAGDFTDTISEYSPVFKRLGFEGKDMTDILSAGLKAGARDTDVVADAFKELSIRAVDGSKTTVDGFKSLNMSAEKMGDAFAAGGDKARIATTDTIHALMKVKDPVEQNRIGVELFGTQWEDTVRNILPALGDFEGASGDATDAAAKMADTMGDNAQGKVDTLKRSFEQWTQSMAAGTDGMSTMATYVVNFGPGAAAMALGVLQAAQAMKALNLTFLANPITLIVVGVVALVAALVLLYKKSETARNIMNEVFSAIGQMVLFLAELWLKGMKLMVSTFLDAAQGILNGAEKAFSWIPGVGDKLSKARDAFEDFRKGADKQFDKAIDKTHEWRESLAKMPKIAKIKGDITNLNEKLSQAKAKLKDPKLTDPERTKIKGDIAQLQDQVRRAKERLASIQDKYVNIYTTEITRKRQAAGGGVPMGSATGGIPHAAEGGIPGGNRVLVGENGPEYAELPYGTRVIASGATRSMALLEHTREIAMGRVASSQLAQTSTTAQARVDAAKAESLERLKNSATYKALKKLRPSLGTSSGTTTSGSSSGGSPGYSGSSGWDGNVTLELVSSGKDVDNMLMEILRRAIRVRGGNVQVVLGKG